MVNKKFSDITVGQIFFVNGVEYVKIKDVRISCCKVVNCHNAANANQRGFFQGNTVVQVNV